MECNNVIVVYNTNIIILIRQVDRSNRNLLNYLFNNLINQEVNVNPEEN